MVMSPDSSPEDRFGARLRYERERRGMTQADVAAALERDHGIKLHPSAIAKMETRDVTNPRVIRLNEAAALSALFGIPGDEMFAPTPAPVPCPHCDGTGWVDPPLDT